MLLWYQAGRWWCQLSVAVMRLAVLSLLIKPDDCFLRPLMLIKDCSVSKWLQVFRLIFACVILQLLHSYYITDWCFFKAHWTYLGWVNMIISAASEQRGLVPCQEWLYLSSILLIFDRGTQAAEVMFFHGNPKSLQIQLSDGIYNKWTETELYYFDVRFRFR